MTTLVEREPRPLETYTLFTGDFDCILDRVCKLEDDLAAFGHLTEENHSFEELLKRRLRTLIEPVRETADVMKAFVGELCDGFVVTVRPISALGGTHEDQVSGVGISSERLDEVPVDLEEFLDLLTLDQNTRSMDEFKEILRNTLNSQRSVGFKAGE